MKPAAAELSLDELLDDPIIQLRMRSAQLRPEKVRACLMAAKRRLQDRHEDDLPSGGSDGGRSSPMVA
jgi:hypothetical protein